MDSSQPTGGSPRRAALVDTAIAVLAEEGGRGLTHRAVDRRLGLPLGSTANYFATRDALLHAAGERLLELDIAAIGTITTTPVTRAEAADAVAARIVGWLAPDARARQLAHLEILLQSARNDGLRRMMTRARQEFVGVATQVLAAVGCAAPADHAPALVALYDGLYLDELLYTDGPTDRRRLTAHIGRFLAGC